MKLPRSGVFIEEKLWSFRWVLSVPFWFSLLGGIFLGIYPLQFGCRIYWHQIFPIFFFAFHVCSICDDITFLILLQQSSLPPPLPHHWLEICQYHLSFQETFLFISFLPSLPFSVFFPFPHPHSFHFLPLSSLFHPFPWIWDLNQALYVHPSAKEPAFRWFFFLLHWSFCPTLSPAYWVSMGF